MNFINLFVSQEYKVSIKNNSLYLCGEEERNFPLEDIGVVMIENNRCAITAKALSKLSQVGAVVFVCDDRGYPASILLPINTYYRPLLNYKLQVSISKPRQKQLWKNIIERKIYNQATCLIKNHKDGGKLFDLAQSVFSGDVDNKEAQASAYYFPALFGKGFSRDQDNIINSCLNYGYALVRGLISRHICARGFLPCLGIFHSNTYNAYNLSDDLIEPFRPIVDYFVYNNLHNLGDEFNSQSKKVLFTMLNLEVFSGKERHVLSYAVEREVESIIAYYSGKDTLILPEIYNKGQKEYE